MPDNLSETDRIILESFRWLRDHPTDIEDELIDLLGELLDNLTIRIGRVERFEHVLRALMRRE